MGILELILLTSTNRSCSLPASIVSSLLTSLPASTSFNSFFFSKNFKNFEFVLLLTTPSSTSPNTNHHHYLVNQPPYITTTIKSKPPHNHSIYHCHHKHILTTPLATKKFTPTTTQKIQNEKKTPEENQVEACNGEKGNKIKERRNKI
ncbi:hypothetical protein E1A91_D07G149900v1 [Gossypium mustelinum]|uniref:Uncharacterized protein n=1 Tax=Gossypium mustelinum TaxID=34275 RepID=A0A5D2UA88_GOSMU|nr:hypothetical protein E1A91_D07G149900v1 [Gossypium mustelinum]